MQGSLLSVCAAAHCCACLLRLAGGCKGPVEHGATPPALLYSEAPAAAVWTPHAPAFLSHSSYCQQEPARKRAKASSRGRSLSELLPAPKNAPTGGGRKLDLLGGGKAAGGRGKAYDSDEDEIVPGAEDRSGMVELRPGERRRGRGGSLVAELAW